MKNFLHNAGSLAIGGVVAQLAFFAIEAYIARKMGASVFGVFIAAYAICLTCLYISDLGTTWKLIQDGSRDYSVLNRCLNYSLIIKLTIFLILYPGVLYVLKILSYEKLTIQVVSILYFYVVSMSIQDSLAGVYIVKERMHINAIFQGLSPVLIGVSIIILLNFNQTPYIVPASYVLGGTLITLVWGIIIYKSQEIRTSLNEIKSFIKGSYLYGLTGLLTQIYFRVDLFVLSFFRDMSEVGIYAAASRLLDLAYKIPILINRVLAPQLFKSSQSNYQEYLVLTDRMLRFIVVIGSLATIFVYCFSNLLITLIFGENYSDSIMVLKILSISFYSKFVFTFLQLILSSSDEHSKRTISMGIVTMLNIGLSVAIIPFYGVIGAASVVVLCDIVLILLSIYSAKDIIKITRLFNISLLPIIVITILIFVSGMYLNSSLLVYFCVILLSILTAVISKFFRADEIQFLVKLLTSFKNKT